MNLSISSSHLVPIVMEPGWPEQSIHKPLPQATTRWFKNDEGIILFQEIWTPHYLFRYFIFSFLREMTLIIKEQGEGLQSLMAIKGKMKFKLHGHTEHVINEGQYLLLDAGHHNTTTTFPAGKECHFFNAYYQPDYYTDLFPLFPSLKKDVQRLENKPNYCFKQPRPSRIITLDGIRAIFYERFSVKLQQYFWNLKLKEVLFAQLVQKYDEIDVKISTTLEKEKAEMARLIIEQDISKHYTNEELAMKVGWSESSLKRAFNHEYGLGMYEYLRRLRMQKAIELLKQGEQVKSAALTVGMRPSHFTMEFQNYFGYKATDVRITKK